MQPFKRLLSLFGSRRKEVPAYALDDQLQTVLETLAEKEQRPAREVHAALLADALKQRRTSEALWQRWQSLSPRERDVTAFSCLGYTNRQIAAHLGVSPDTVKGYVRQVLVKFQLHSKDELRLRLGDWDFSNWGTRATY